ncbi:assimilatory nitrite reductase (NAD(P)H) large subunit precursor [Acidothermus cellulolyticus 11B]|uniref:assimilatory sulfite reductase (ferredoxin) n=1 Tax=Acidothermus cellulolyticus (strain ATCC 43068 / DSM 8971 / 11B) TaxID=351607 RepID=A0LVQ6_ACIC1|nr:nitrite reductase large subunit NirB [Acidothermus cellulolyticus]ABK53516.1 assimilatory nitrite reductase (NAD(P)H) large subunit precursor [Acidothermus cellulolyticus 11B]
MINEALTPGAVRRIVLVGYGMVGHHFLDRFVQLAEARGGGMTYRVTVFAAEKRPAYDRVSLSSYFEGKSADDLQLGSAGDWPNVDIRLGDPAISFDVTGQQVRGASGWTERYDIAVLATGSRPFVPPVEGAARPGCFVYRTLDDLDAIRQAAERAHRGVVVGAGLLGLEAANALRLLGLQVAVVERADRPLPLQVDAGGGAILRRQIETLGIDLRTGVTVTSILGPDGAGVQAVALDDGAILETDLVVFAAGVRPEDDLARQAGLAVGRRGGIVVDDTCMTSAENVYAIGECACVGGVDGTVYGLVAPGYAMADTVARRLCGEPATLGTLDTSTKLKSLGVDVASFGDAFATTPGALDVVFADHVRGVYRKIVVSNDAKRLLGGILVGDISAYPILRGAVGSELSVDPQELLVPADQVVLGGPASLGEEATVCSCHNVSAGVICSAIREGAEDVAAIKSVTRAGTCCGSCVPLLKTLLEAELAKLGKEPQRGLCEHFDLTRQEIFEIVAIRGISSFDELIEQYGRGRGCDICKPVVASILAGRPGAHPLDAATAALQDTNDHVMANLQRDGSYSVVPRIPGGEITPDGLITIGTIAKEFGLYTKITGGQRIDMFGARLEQLPCIWQRLVEAGFESGHAYGKAMRTVKSCVGSTWCRYGVQDSVRLAIKLELRYRGLRAPHKIKAAVSGCARECAEARGKDVGVIASERGWNLYVGGNGGFSPRHAELLAADLDEETLVRYIDRFLMYYIRTADRLQRTASWLENIQGGLDHVRAVIIDDSLGLCAELDAAMERHVASYVDEWAATLKDPRKLAQFRTFVNAPEQADPDIVFVPERHQHRPASPEERRRLATVP